MHSVLNFAILLSVALALLGCARKEETASEPDASSSESEQTAVVEDSADTPAAQQSAARDSAAAPRQSVAAQSVQGVVDPFLTSQLRIFIQQKGRLPESFAEFAGARLDSVPRLAKGLTFVIDSTTHEVKIARQ